jgi:hypothetical protein
LFQACPDDFSYGHDWGLCYFVPGAAASGINLGNVYFATWISLFLSLNITTPACTAMRGEEADKEDEPKVEPAAKPVDISKNCVLDNKSMFPTYQRLQACHNLAIFFGRVWVFYPSFRLWAFGGFASEMKTGCRHGLF